MVGIFDHTRVKSAVFVVTQGGAGKHRMRVFRISSDSALSCMCVLIFASRTVLNGLGEAKLSRVGLKAGEGIRIGEKTT